MKSISNARGSTIVEAIFAASAIALLFTSLLVVAYLCFAKVWSDNRVYETMICVAEKNPQWQCEQALSSSLQTVLSLSQIDNLLVTSRPDSIDVQLHLEVLKGFHMNEEQSLKLPLQGKL
jgi:hypothetical protein